MGSLTSKATTSSKDAVHASTSSKEITQTSARWEQSYSFDGGKTSRPTRSSSTGALTAVPDRGTAHRAHSIGHQGLGLAVIAHNRGGIRSFRSPLPRRKVFGSQPRTPVSSLGFRNILDGRSFSKARLLLLLTGVV
jgi:hypothetical protein